MPVSGPIDPDRLAATEFSTAFRGYDTGEVRALLHSVGAALREAAEREHDLREQLGRAEAHLRELRETSAAQVEEAAEEARREGREMVAEAQRVRERMLGDLARRRRNARQQVEQLMAGRERLLEAFDAARHTIDAATQDMRGALPEARLAAEAAGRRFDQDVAGEDDDVAVAALEDEIDAARLVGLPLVAPEPEPVSEAPPPGPNRSESSLLGERDVREMPPVELGADFEDVRIVPVEATTEAPADTAVEVEADAGEPAPTEAEEAGDAVDESDVPEDERALTDGPEDERALTDGSEVDVADGDGAEGAAADEEAATGEADADGGVDGGAAEEVVPDLAPVDPGHLDDLFASLRAARAEAVSDARSVLERTDAEDPGADASEDAPLDDESVDPAEVAPTAAPPEATPGERAEPETERAPEPGTVTEPVVDADLEPDVAPEPGAGPVLDAALASQDQPESVAPVDQEPESATPAVDVEATIAAAGERLASALKRALAHEQNELFDRLRQVGRGRRADEPGVLGDATDVVARFSAAAEVPLAEVAGVAMASAAPDKRARPPAIEPLATAAAAELVEPLYERLTRGFGEAGTDTAEASARARATFREWKTQRIGIGAADASRAAFHAGLLAGVGRSTTLVWRLDDEDAACPECADNALAGPVGRGQRFPTGHRHPPAHDGCRCTLVVAEEPAS